jgi:hypothetical protein
LYNKSLKASIYIHNLVVIILEPWQAIEKILNWLLIEDIIRKVTNTKLDEETKLIGLRKLGKTYGESLFEMPPDEIEKELVAIYIESMKKNKKYVEPEKPIKKMDEGEEEKDFIEGLDERAKLIPELQYFNSMMKKNPEFKKIVKKLRFAKNEDEEEDLDKDNDPSDTMYI